MGTGTFKHEHAHILAMELGLCRPSDTGGRGASEHHELSIVVTVPGMVVGDTARKLDGEAAMSV